MCIAGGPEYERQFRVAAPQADRVSAVQWARNVFEHAPRALRWFLLVGWRGVLRLRLEPSSPGCVLGWTIRRADAGSAEIVTGSGSLDTSLRFDVDRSGIRVHSVVAYRRRRARFVWAVIRPVHELVLPWALRGAARRHVRSVAS